LEKFHRLDRIAKARLELTPAAAPIAPIFGQFDANVRRHIISTRNCPDRNAA